MTVDAAEEIIYKGREIRKFKMSENCSAVESRRYPVQLHAESVEILRL